MTKAELVEKVANQINLTKKQTEVVVNTVFSSITDSLSEGKKVELSLSMVLITGIMIQLFWLKKLLILKNMEN